MKGLAAGALLLVGCMADLAVGVSMREVEPDAGGADAAIDAGRALLDASDDSVTSDAGVRYWPCPISDCWAGFTVLHGCDDASVEFCARTDLARSCQLFCL